MSARESLLDAIPEGWRSPLRVATEQASFASLADDLAEEAKGGIKVYPPAAQVFRALELTPLRDIRAVILGQDPYYTEGLATGLAFSVPERCDHPKSLQNILKARKADLGLAMPSSGSLERRAHHGVLLLNTSLTVRDRVPNSHRRRWKPFTDAVIELVAAQDRPILFLLWGSQAQQVRSRIVVPDRYIIDSPHPASRRRGTPFIDSTPFQRADEAMRALREPRIDWSLSGDHPPRG